MKSFREHIAENSEADEVWTKEDLISLIREEDLDFEDIQEITELVTEIIEFGEFDDIEDEDLENLDYDFDNQWLDEKCHQKQKKMQRKKEKNQHLKKHKD
jgi:hypothetical protein